MATRSTRSSTGTTRRRRRVRKDDEAENQAAESAEESMDDASDVIFDEPAEEEEPKPKRRRKKAASRRRTVKSDDEAESETDSGPEAESVPESADDRDADYGDEEPYPVDEEGRDDDNGDERDERDDGEGPPRRRRRRRRGRRSFDGRDGRDSRDSRDQRDGRRGSRRGGRGGRGGNFDRRRPGGRRVRNVLPSDEIVEGTIEGVLELHPKRYGFLRDPQKNYVAQESDPFVPSALVEKCRLLEGVLIKGEVGPGVRDQGPRLHEIELIDGLPVEEYQALKRFDDLTPITPFRHINLETDPNVVTMRVMDMLTPVGKGQRALIVAPPRTGKTMLLQDIANAVSRNHPEMELMVLLVDERPEEVTEMRRKVNGEVIASSMDRDVESHVRMSQLIVERAKRMAEGGKDVFVLMDSITRMARAFNKWAGGGGGGRGRGDGGTMSGGLHIKALDIPKKLFGTARQFEEGGSLTIVATALIETNSRMDEVIFQEFKGTGNMELVLSRDLADRRIWPAIDITRSGTRHEEKLFSPEELESVTMLRRSLISLSPVEAMEQLTRTLERFPTNAEFLARVKSIL